MGKDYHAQGRITTPRELEKDFLQLRTDHKKAHGEGLPRPGSWKKNRISSASKRPGEGISGRITTPRELEKDFLQLTTDQKKAYGEGLPRPGSGKKIFFSQQLATDQKKASLSKLRCHLK